MGSERWAGAHPSDPAIPSLFRPRDKLLNEVRPRDEYIRPILWFTGGMTECVRCRMLGRGYWMLDAGWRNWVPYPTFERSWVPYPILLPKAVIWWHTWQTRVSSQLESARHCVVPAQSKARHGVRWQSEARPLFPVSPAQIAQPHHYFVPATNYWTKFVPATNTFHENCDSLSRMTTSQSYMRCRGPGVRVRPGRADTLRNWPFLQLIAAACTFLQLWAVGREERGHFLQLISPPVTYLHIFAPTFT